MDAVTVMSLSVQVRSVEALGDGVVVGLALVGDAVGEGVLVGVCEGEADEVDGTGVGPA